MKKIYLFWVVAVLSFTSCHNDIWNSINDLDSRVKALEELCREMNTNISSLQALIEVIQSGDYITNIVPITKGGEVIGYTIMFKNHEPITIYNGEDGVTANTPIIGAAQDTDGVYYWTVNGEWLLDDNGNKIRVTGRDGQNGQDGNDGQPGSEGQTGPQGITPTLKIENGMWYVSYDNGSTWTMLGQATGDPGQPGQNGQDGESIFTNITYDANSVTFTLSDGTTITIPRSNGTGGTIHNVPIIDGAIIAEFSVSDSTKIYFSMGNLQFQPSLGMHMCADDTMRQGTFRFASRQYYYLGQRGAATLPNMWIDCFCFGQSGYNQTEPWYYKNSLTSSEASTAPRYRERQSLIGGYANYDIGWFNAISNGGNEPNIWRLPTKSEIDYLLNNRIDATYLHFVATVGDQEGIVILPDNWSNSELNYNLNTSVASNQYSTSQWALWEAEGAIFIPANMYWTSTYGTSNDKAWIYNWRSIIQQESYYTANSTPNSYHISYGSVRLVKDVPTSSNN